MAAWLSDNKPLSQWKGTCTARVAANKAINSRPPAIPQTNPFTCGRVSWSPKASAGKPSRRSNILLPNNSRATPHAASIARAKSAPGSRFGKNITPANANPYATTHKPRNSQRDFFCTAGLVNKVFRFSVPIRRFCEIGFVYRAPASFCASPKPDKGTALISGEDRFSEVYHGVVSRTVCRIIGGHPPYKETKCCLLQQTTLTSACNRA